MTSIIILRHLYRQSFFHITHILLMQRQRRILRMPCKIKLTSSPRGSNGYTSLRRLRKNGYFGVILHIFFPQGGMSAMGNKKLIVKPPKQQIPLVCSRMLEDPEQFLVQRHLFDAIEMVKC